MFDYIQIYENYSELGGYAVPAKDLIISFALGILIFVVALLILKNWIEEVGVLVLFSLLFSLAFALAYITLFVSPENTENLAQIKKYNIKSVKNLGNNIATVQEELGIVENKSEETNKILNKFYKNDKNLSLDEEKIVKKLKN